MRTSYLIFGLAFAAVAYGLGGCFTDESLVICAGQISCDCLAGNTCNAGLTCSGGKCVAGAGSSSSSSSSSSQTPADASMSGDGSPTDDGSASNGDATTGDDGMTGSPEGAAQDAPASGSNLITNGDFSQGTTMWGGINPTVTPTVMNGELCLSVTGSGMLAWPQPSGTAGPAIASGTSYTLTYTARTTSMNATIDAKVAHTDSPYTPVDFDTSPATDAITTTATKFTHMFTPTAADSSAGLAFTITSTAAQSVCFQSVSLVAN